MQLPATRLDISLYETMYLVRRAEAEIARLYPENEMKTPMHMSHGQEAIAAGVCAALRANDQTLGSYRSHALYLARTGDIDGFWAELYGKASGPGRGRQGSMHLADPDLGLVYSSAIVAAQIPLSLGVAFAKKRQKENAVVAVFFGDGAVEEGAFWESLNAASLLKLPILFVCEDNELAIHTTKRERRGFKDLARIVGEFDCNLRANVANDAAEIHSVSAALVAEIRETKRPAFLHVPCFRYLEHVGVDCDFRADYRPTGESEAWQGKDPLVIQRERIRLAKDGEATLARLEAELDAKIETAVLRARAAPFAENRDLLEDVYAP